MALMSAKLISELHALSVCASCLLFSPDYGKVMSITVLLCLMLACYKSSCSCPKLELLAFHPLPFVEESDRWLNLLCPIRAIYWTGLKDLERVTSFLYRGPLLTEGRL